MIDEPRHVPGVLGEADGLLVEHVVAPEACPQRRAAHQRKEGEAAANGSRFSFLKNEFMLLLHVKRWR